MVGMIYVLLSVGPDTLSVEICVSLLTDRTLGFAQILNRLLLKAAPVTRRHTETHESTCTDTLALLKEEECTFFLK